MNKDCRNLRSEKVRKNLNFNNYPPWYLRAQFSREICRDAEVEYAENMRTKLDYHFNTSIFYCSLFSKCPVVNGISKEFFLKRFLSFTSISNTDTHDCPLILSQNVWILQQEEIKKCSFLQQTDALEAICEVFGDPKLRMSVDGWMKENGRKLWQTMINILQVSDILAMSKNVLPKLVTQTPSNEEEMFLLVPDALISTSFFLCVLSNRYQLLEANPIPLLVTDIPGLNDGLGSYLQNALTSIINRKSKKESDLSDRESLDTLMPSSDTVFQKDPIFNYRHQNDLARSCALYCQAFLLDVAMTNFDSEVLAQFLFTFRNAIDIDFQNIYLDFLETISEIVVDSLMSNQSAESASKVGQQLLEGLWDLPSRDHFTRMRVMAVSNQLRGILKLSPSRKYGSTFVNTRSSLGHLQWSYY